MDLQRPLTVEQTESQAHVTQVAERWAEEQAAEMTGLHDASTLYPVESKQPLIFQGTTLLNGTSIQSFELDRCLRRMDKRLRSAGSCE